MYRVAYGQRAALRATLLLGAAGAAAAVSTGALADQASQSPPSDPQKWSPYSSIGGAAGSQMVAGKLDFFVPLFQNQDSLLFLNLGVGTETKAHTLYNLGVGYRTEIDADWIVGLYAGHDGTQLQDNNTFGQTALGAELMSADWDVRLNGYLADNAPKPIPGQFGLYLNGTTIGILQGQDAGYSGFDGEVGYRVFNDDNTDVRVFIGGFHFGHGNTNNDSMGQRLDFGYRDITGPKARAELTVYDIDAIGSQSRLTLDGEISHDDVRGTTGFVGATLRIPLGNFSGGGGAQALSELDRRMVDPERRNDTVVTHSEMSKLEPVIIYGPGFKSQPTNTLLYVDNTLGAGTYANPTTFADAAARPTTNAFIVLQSKQGPIMGGATLQPGQTVVAGGQTFTVEGEFSHAKFTHLFDPSTDVTLIPATPGGNVVTLASNTSIYGVAIKGDFGTAIYGKNVDHVSISHVTIDGTGGGQYGIVIKHTQSGEEIVNIDNVALSNVSAEGIYLTSHISDGGISTEAFTLDNIAISNPGSVGVDIQEIAAQGSRITSATSLSNVSVTNTAYGITAFTAAYGIRSSIDQTITIANASVIGTAHYGIALNSFAIGGASVTSNDTVTGSSVANGGLLVETYADGAGSNIDQSFTASGFTSGGNQGIVLRTKANAGSVVAQTDTLSNLTLSGDADGVYLYAEASGAGSNITQTASVSNAALSNITFDGIYFAAAASSGASIDQSVSITGATIALSAPSHLSRAGIEGLADAVGAGTVVTQTASVANASVTGATSLSSGGGIYFDAIARNGGASAQYVTLNNVSVASSSNAIGFTATAVDNGVGVTTAYQKATVTGVTASNNTGEGIGVYAYAGSGSVGGYQSKAAVGQNISITNATLSHDSYGFIFGAAAHNGASVNQTVSAYGFAIDHSVYDGVRIADHAQVVGSLTQSITFNDATGLYNEITYNARNGIFVTNYALSGGQINQHLYIYNTNIDHNTLDGIRVKNRSEGYYYAHNGSGIYHYSHIQQNLIAAVGSISNNGGDGVYISNFVGYGGAEHQTIELYGEKLDHNVNGFYEKSLVSTYYGVALPTPLHSDVYIYKSDLSYNSNSGAVILAQTNGPDSTSVPVIGYSGLVQNIVIGGSTFNHNQAGDGLAIAAYDFGLETLTQQTVSISGSQFAYNRGNGARFIASQTYGTGPYGDAIQSITIAGSDFSHNYGDGLLAAAVAIGEQGRAEQYFTVSNTTFNSNGENGIFLNRVAEEGVYVSGFPCFAVQNPGGGCAFVRQTFDMFGGSASGNGAYGLYIRNLAFNYGAIYSGAGHNHAPTVLLYGAQFNNNGVDGLYSNTSAGNGSYVFNSIEVIDTTFNGNGRDGFYVKTYAGHGSRYSVIVERNLLYSYATGTTANNNGRNGFNIYDDATGGSYIFSSNSTLGHYGAGVTATGNAGDGIAIGAANFFFVYGVGYVSQHNQLYANAITSNGGDGLRLFAGGPGVGYARPSYYQSNKLVGNKITGNTGYGIYGEAIFGAYQNDNVLTGGNTVTSNTAGQYSFISNFGGVYHVN